MCNKNKERCYLLIKELLDQEAIVITYIICRISVQPKYIYIATMLRIKRNRYIKNDDLGDIGLIFYFILKNILKMRDL